MDGSSLLIFFLYVILTLTPKNNKFLIQAKKKKMTGKLTLYFLF